MVVATQVYNNDDIYVDSWVAYYYDPCDMNNANLVRHGLYLLNL